MKLSGKIKNDHKESKNILNPTNKEKGGALGLWKISTIKYNTQWTGSCRMYKKRMMTKTTVRAVEDRTRDFSQVKPVILQKRPPPHGTVGTIQLQSRKMFLSKIHWKKYTIKHLLETLLMIKRGYKNPVCFWADKRRHLNGKALT